LDFFSPSVEGAASGFFSSFGGAGLGLERIG